MITDIERPEIAPESVSVAPPGAAQARRVAVNSLVPFAANILGRVLALGMAVVMARTLGPAGTGAYAFAVNLWLYASIISDFGLGTWLTREIARDPAGGREAVRLSTGLRLAVSAIACVVLVGVAGVYVALGIGNAQPEIVATCALLGLGLLPGAVSAAGSALFNAHERMVFPAAIQLGGAILTTGAGAVVLLAGYGIVGLAWVSLGVNLVTAAVFLLASARRYFPLGATLAPSRQVALARETLPLMLNGLLNNVFFRIDIQVLQAKGSAIVGNYANAYKVIDAAGAVPSSFVLALFPLLSRRAARDGRDGLQAVFALALKLLLVTALGLAVTLTALAADIQLLAWGPEFLPHSAIALQVLVWFLPLSFFNGLTQYVLIALGLQARITPAFALAAAFNVGANLALIPRFSYVAAAGVTIATEVVLLVPFLLALRGRTDLRHLLGEALRPVPAAALLALLLWLLLSAGWHWLFVAALAAPAYLPLVLLTRTFRQDERALLWSAVRRR